MRRALLFAALALAACKSEPPAPAAVLDAGAPAAPAPPAVLTNLTAEQTAHAAELSKNSCLACHTQEMLDQQRLTPQQWAATVKKMTGWGAPMEHEDPALLAGYLAARGGLDAGTYTLSETTPAQAEALVEPTPDGAYTGGDATRGEQVYRTSCATCHGMTGRGDALGVNVVDRPMLYRADEFAALVKKGRNRMPETAGILPGDIAALLAYLRGLPGV